MSTSAMAVAVRAPRSSSASSPKISPSRATVSTIFCPAVSLMNSSTSPRADDEERFARLAGLKQRRSRRQLAPVDDLRQLRAILLGELLEKLVLREHPRITRHTFLR